MAAPWLLTVSGWLLLAEILALLVVPWSWAAGGSDIERQWILDAIGPDLAGWVFDTTDVLWRDGIIHTGVEAWVQALLLPAADATDPFSVQGQEWFAYVAGRIDIVFIQGRQALRRALLMLAWLPWLLLLLAPAVVDAHMVWRRRRHGFHYSSPLIHRLALEMVLVILILFWILLSFPLPVPPLYAPMFCVVLAAAAVLIGRSSMKQL